MSALSSTPCSPSANGSGERNVIETGWETSSSEECDLDLPGHFRDRNASASLESWGHSLGGRDIPLLPGLGSIDEEVATRHRLSQTALPAVGSTFKGFHLVAELGRGAFGRVFLARQGDLANRLVALKISTESIAESQKLAQLQHTHIVPIYSFHQDGPLQAVCMPYFGSTTLSDVLNDLQQGRLPNSGKQLISTVQNRQSQTARSLRSNRPDSGVLPLTDAASNGIELPSDVPSASPATVRQLEGLSYVEAVLWLGARLADGLAHAHERGILHRDLKPANILLTNDGQPMLLDFNLAEDTKQYSAVSAAMIGGTLPYMAPEHLMAFQGQDSVVDHRADIYALGLILTELLLGRPLFARHAGLMESTLPRMIAERNQQPPALGKENPEMTPAVEAILRRCLQPDPAQRYQSARELQEDLDRHLRHQPLKFTPEPSRIERLRKWARRNPRLTSTTSLAIFSVLTILALVTLVLTWGHRLARLEAQERHQALVADLPRARVLLAGRGVEPSEVHEGASVAQTALERFAALEKGPETLPSVLSTQEKAEIRTEVAELLLLLASTQADLKRALDYNQRAATWLGEEQIPGAVHLQRAAILHRLGRELEAQQERERAALRPVRSAWEQALLAREQMRQGEIATALEHLREVVRKDPGNVSAWYLLGNCALEGAAHQLALETDAVSAYTACLALAPEYPGLYLSRGLAHLRLRNYREAEVDFSTVLRLKPALTLAHLYRAIAWEGLGRPEKALEDVDAAIAGGVTSTRAYATRARLRGMQGDHRGSQLDRAEALKQEPTDDEGFVVRGIMRLATDVPGALADFEAAVRLNPRSLAGLQNQAHVLAEKLNQPQQAIARLNQVLRTYPNLASGYAGRAVLYARLGDRARAHQNAREALQLDASGETAYQVAGVYALTSVGNPQDRELALTCLASGLRQGYGLDLVDEDPDLAPLKSDPRRQEIVQAARILQARAAMKLPGK